MGYLLAEMAVLLVLAALLGAALSHWWLRRQFTDVTQEYQTLKQSAGRDVETQRIATPSALDLGELKTQIEDLKRDNTALAAAVTKQLSQIPDKVNEALPELAKLSTRMEALKSSLPRPGHLDALSDRMSRMESTLVRASRPPVAPASGSTEVLERLNALESRLPSSSDVDRLAQAVRDLQAQMAQEPASIPSATESIAPSGQPDPLTRISGIGTKLERTLNDLGIYYFRQIADWTPDDLEYVGRHLEGFKGRIVREEWVKQAKHLVAENTAQAAPAPTRESIIRPAAPESRHG